MLDVHFVRENFDLAREKLATRNFDVALLAAFNSSRSRTSARRSVS